MAATIKGNGHEREHDREGRYEEDEDSHEHGALGGISDREKNGESGGAWGESRDQDEASHSHFLNIASMVMRMAMAVVTNHEKDHVGSPEENEEQRGDVVDGLFPGKGVSHGDGREAEKGSREDVAEGSPSSFRKRKKEDTKRNLKSSPVTRGTGIRGYSSRARRLT